MPEGNPDYTQNVKIIGTDEDGNLVAVLLDDAGRILAVLKGMSDDGLKTIAVDDEGHLIALLADPYDLWAKRPTIGLAELAARLGSPNCLDRRGQTLVTELWRKGLANWNFVPDGVDSAAAIVDHPSFFGDYSAKLTTGNLADDTPEINRVLPYVGNHSYGVEIHTNFPVGITIITLKLEVYSGTVARTYGIQWWPQTKKLYYLNDLGGWTEFAETFTTKIDPTLFYFLKLVGSVATTKYVRVILNGLSYSVSGYDCSALGVATTPHIQVTITVTTGVDANTDAYIGGVLVTYKEPAAD